MPQNLIINDVKYNNVESISMLNENGDKVVYKEEIDATSVASILLSEKLNYYTGETGVMSMEEAIDKIDLILAAYTNNKNGGSYFHYHYDTVVEFPPLDTSAFTTFHSMYTNAKKATKFPEVLDGTNVTSCIYMFNYCTVATDFPRILGLSNCTNFSDMFAQCTKAINIPDLNTSNGISFVRMFYSCKSLVTAPEIDTSNGEDFLNMFEGCTSLVTIPKLNLSSAIDRTSNMFRNCTSLENIKFEGEIYWTLNFSFSPLLTRDSLMSIINALHDYSTDTSGVTHSLVLGAKNLAKLTDAEKAIATQKGWTLS